VWANPGQLFNRNGHAIDVRGEVWPLSDYSGNCFINWNLLVIALDFKDSMKAYLAHVIESQAPRAASSVFVHLKRCVSQLPPVPSLEELSYSDIESVLVRLRNSGNAWEFGHMRRWYAWCARQGIPGFTVEIAKTLSKLKVATNSTGMAVHSRDPERGPLNDEEHWLVRQALKYKQGPLLERVCVMLMLELGARPGQLILLNEGDYRAISSPKGQRFCSLEISRLKQNQLVPEKKSRRISSELGESIEELIQENHRLYGDTGSKSPLLRSMNKESKSIGRMTGLIFLYRSRSYARKIGMISPRTGTTLDLYPYRLRYTFGTRHANQGTPAAVLADLLDHSSRASISVYTKATNNSVVRLNEAVGSNTRFSSLISRFLGQVDEGTSSIDSHNVINGSTPTLKNLGGLGTCGANFICNLMPPLSCYICPKFRAWKDGPHQEMLKELESYQEQLVQSTRNSSDRIPLQLNETIAAVKDLLAMLDQMQTPSP